MNRLFLSVDIAGSTAFKTKHRDPNEASYWPRLYEGFMEDFPAKLAAVVQEESDAEKVSLEVDIWKLLGDEIIFESQVSDPLEAHALTRAFYLTLHAEDERWRRVHGLRLRGTAFTAEFPNENKLILLERASSNSPDGRDFIGPDIDLGFRLTKAARPGCLVVSMDLVDILARISPSRPLIFHWVGWEHFKGVYADKPYPVFWVTNERSPYLYPWDEHTCRFTEAYLKGCSVEREVVLGRIAEIRAGMNEVTDLRLFSPYFSTDKAPDQHKSQREVRVLEDENLSIGDEEE